MILAITNYVVTLIESKVMRSFQRILQNCVIGVGLDSYADSDISTYGQTYPPFPLSAKSNHQHHGIYDCQ